MRRLLVIMVCLCACLMVRGQTALYGYRYWFDQKQTVYKGTSTAPQCHIDAKVSSLKDGLHALYIQIECNDTLSSPQTYLFVKSPVVTGVRDIRCMFWVDGELFRNERISSTDGTMAWTIDVSSLTEGVHQYMIQTVMPTGVCSNFVTGTFLYATEADELGNMKCYYIVDNDTAAIAEATTISNGLYHFDLDVSTLSDGLHSLGYWLVGENGTCTATMSTFFTKIPLGGSGITEFQYWLNDLDDQKQITTYDPRQDMVSILALLPVETQPIRSSCFHFETNGGKPMMFAKNDIHVRFYDAAGRFTDVTKQYVDESVKQEVKPVGELQTTQTFAKVTENDVRWYTMQAAPGDTVAFKLSQPATIQLFAPSGTEVFKTSESASTKWSGIHVWEDGTYYLAVHDVTGSQSTMKLEYMHMDKYDVVDWDVHRVGNGGCSTITFKGNGFRDLYAVDLVIAPGDTIHSVDVSHDSDAETAVTFDFTGATLGDYNAVFHFTEKDKHVANVVTVEEAVDIELATDVSFPSSFLSGTSTTYTIKITNKGNMTAYAVPIYVYIRNRSKDAISYIKFEGLDLLGIFSLLSLDSLDNSELKELRDMERRISDDHYFTFHKIDGKPFNSDSVIVRSNYFFTNISPNTTKTIKLQIKSSEEVFVWVTTPDEWLSINTSIEPKSSKNRYNVSSKASDAICCYRERFECFFNATANVVGIVNLLTDLTGENPVSEFMRVADCAAGAINFANSFMWTIACGEKEPLGGDDWFSDMFAKLFHLKNVSGIGVISNCIQAFFPKLKWKNMIKKIGTTSSLMDIFSIVNVWDDCEEAFTEWKPGCPPNDGNGGNSTPQPPSDPNDIFGYLSEAGSKFITDSVARVNYTIEFENDTTFATAAAHTIVIKDTLDSRYFDLTKFMPTGVRIGGHDVFLDEADVVTSNSKTSFIKTIDMRPEINAIAQVDGEYNPKNGIAQWTFQSLDPMTMEPTDDLMQGILPVNYDGTSGIGEVMFEVGVKSGKADGTKIDNRAGIVFDYEEAILTPTWTNIVDAVAPSSIVDGITMLNDSTLRVFADASDERSGVWKYEWYVQHGENAPWWKEGETYDDCFDFHFYEGFDYGFCVVVTDSAGNVEKKELARERIFKSYGPDFDNAVSISPLTASPNVEGQVYDLSGRRHDEPQEGINIIDKKKVLFRRKGK